MAKLIGKTNDSIEMAFSHDEAGLIATLIGSLWMKANAENASTKNNKSTAKLLMDIWTGFKEAFP